ncbi:uncharacterized protein LAESUDRAFT_723343 [Laetiporus sulphureus 93-53]|uniref:Uncharacterized protein n=1 Tax=Laetiporus sulphureus 93-53 TaxID=1314785 RepID=A0A165FIY1_9APHY|nr:uncharacterized protein LAESUDRAFT_723343 [Laetiporus sulphureus 93-53]KZT09041.1 hypothetical protein LAESUDRAFT_723343 [Laetiporus sulphureus 93-53]
MPSYTSVFDFPCDGPHHIVNQSCPLTMSPIHLVGDGAASGSNDSSAIVGV